MNTFTRSTHEYAFVDLNPELVTVIHNHIEKYKLGDSESSFLICCETTSANRKAGLFANGVETAVAVRFVTPQLLVWTIENKKR